MNGDQIRLLIKLFSTTNDNKSNPRPQHYRAQTSETTATSKNKRDEQKRDENGKQQLKNFVRKKNKNTNNERHCQW